MALLPWLSGTNVILTELTAVFSCLDTAYSRNSTFWPSGRSRRSVWTNVPCGVRIEEKST
jgi:hypothetical protein